MSYEPTNWKTGDVVTSAKLNKLENGVAGNFNVDLVVSRSIDTQTGTSIYTIRDTKTGTEYNSVTDDLWSILYDRDTGEHKSIKARIDDEQGGFVCYADLINTQVGTGRPTFEFKSSGLIGCSFTGGVYDPFNITYYVRADEIYATEQTVYVNNLVI